MEGRLSTDFSPFSPLNSDIAREWCELNKVCAILRSHEVRNDGYEEEHDVGSQSTIERRPREIDSLFSPPFLSPMFTQGHTVTIFSASNYVDQVGNKGAFARINAQGSIKYIQFDAQPHPDLKPMACECGRTWFSISFLELTPHPNSLQTSKDPWEACWVSELYVSHIHLTFPLAASHHRTNIQNVKIPSIHTSPSSNLPLPSQ